MTTLSTPSTPRARAAVDALPAYRPGRGVADAMAAHGLATAVKLASNELPWGPVPAVLDAIGAAAADLHRYPDNRSTALRTQLAGRHGVRCEQVTVGAGASGLLQALALAYVGPGDEVVRGDPSFEAYPIYTRLVGGTDVAVPAAEWTLDLAAMAAAVTDRTRLVIVANPNNPTGTAVPAGAVHRLADAIPASCLLVVDGAYREFMANDDGALALAAERPNVIVLRTFSKAFGLAGLRVGYAIGAAPVVAALDKVALPFVVGSLAQAAASAALGAEGEVQQRVAALGAERDRVSTRLAQLGWRLPTFWANFVWLPCGPAATEVGMALERAGIVGRPFDGLGVRVTIGRVTDNDEFLGAIEAIGVPSVQQ
jgi:histidinol-phosphate aminotransferase